MPLIPKNTPPYYTQESGGTSLTPKTYKALLRQAGTNAPTATIFINTLGGTVVLSRAEAGVYGLELPTATSRDKIFINGANLWYGNQPIQIPLGGNSIAGYIIIYGSGPGDVVEDIFIETKSPAFALVEMNTLIDDLAIEFAIYQ